MKREIPQEELIIKRNRRKRVWRRAVMAMACVVVFFTTYALILPAITMEHSCALEEHAHSEGCYENETLVCVMEEHRHDIHCEGTKETETLAETESAQTEEIQAETSPATENPETTATTESAETVPMETAVTETVPQETQVGDIVMEDSGEQGALFIYTPTEEIGRGTYEGRKLKCGQDGAEGHSHTTDCYEPSTLTWVVTKNTITGEHTLTIHGKGEMPDNQKPWTDIISNTTPRYIAIGPDTDAKNEEERDEITYIGQSAFNVDHILGISISNTVHTIGANAFSYATFLDNEINIPGTVKVIKGNAFLGAYVLERVTLNEGTEIIEGNAFRQIGISKIHIPSTAKLDRWVFYGTGLSEITVAEGNPWNVVVDGVLFSLRNDNTWLLNHYPLADSRTSYIVPEEIDGKPVSAIDGSFSNSLYLRDLTIPDTVDKIGGYSFQGSSVEKVILKCDQLNDSQSAFVEASKLREIVITQLQVIPSNFFLGSGLQKVSIPKGMTYIGSWAFRGCPLEEIYFDAVSACIDPSTNCPVFDYPSKDKFTLTIGRNVDTLVEKSDPWPNGSAFRFCAEQAKDIVFEGENQITIAEGAMAGAPAPFTDLSGTIYVDKQGVVYTYDDSGATLIYCPAGVEELAVPATLPEMAGNIPVTAVGKEALKYAENLESITFADPAAVTSLETLAMANCMTLTSVNGYDNETEATASFTNSDIQMGYNVFYNTGLKGVKNSGTFEQDMSGGKGLTVTGSNAADLHITTTCERWGGEGETGGYKLLTGEQVSLFCSTGSVFENQTARYRVYLRFTSEEGYAPAPGTKESYGESGWEITYYATEDPYTVCAEFGAPPAGASGGLPIGVYYPHYSRGGGLTVWGVVLEGSPAISGDSEKRPIVESDNVMQFSWSTKKNSYTLTTAPTETKILETSADGAGNVRPNANLGWTIALKRSEEVLEYGKDPVRYVEIEDRMILPAGITLRTDIKEAIANNQVRFSNNCFYAGEQCVAWISAPPSGTRVSNGMLAWDDENNTVVASWRYTNTSKTVDVASISTTLTFEKSFLVVDAGKTFPLDKTADFKNHVSATVHYTYGESAGLGADPASRMIKGIKATFTVGASHTAVKYFGEDVDFSVYVKNVGAVHFTPEDWGYENELACYLRFTLCDSNRKGRYYIKPENMERMFKENNSLVITITNAVLREWDDATDTNGGTVQIHTSNSQFEDEKTGNTLTISYDSGAEESKYLIAVNDGAPAAYKSVAEGLQAVGYAVTDEALYECLFRMNEPGEIFSINGGETKYRMVYATVKDSFQIIGVDEEHQYNGDPLDITSPAKFYSEISKKVPDRLPNHIETPDGTTTAWDVTREAVLTKSVTKADGSAMAENFAVKHGDVLDYRIHFTHYGSGCYENLPLVDELRGSQYLLVPIKENPGLVDKDLETHGDCYILTEGEYKNVAVGVDDEEKLLTAHSISVKKLEGTEGLHTTIKWYFDSLPSGNYAMYVDYQTLVSLDLTGVNYSVHSEVWMNDREGSRLYDSFGGGGTLLEYQKEIVEQRGSKPEKDELFEDGYSLVGPGEQVTYRLALENPNDFEITLNGTNMADMLPDTRGAFDWEKDVNITGFDIKTEGDVTLKNMDLWELGTEYGGLLDARDYILWPGAASVTLPKDGKAYIYFTLTYPEDGGEDSAWDKYVEAMGGDPIDNRMYVYRYPSTVKHDLEETGRVMLQKGVYGSYYYNNHGGYGFMEIGSRKYYNNRDNKERAVMYYVTVLNDGNKRLYLSDIYDVLPEGFDYFTMPDGTLLPNVAVHERLTRSDDNNVLVNIQKESGEEIIFRNATVTATKLENGVKFSFSEGSGGYPVHWDKERNQGYLNRNEAIVFGYICVTNEAEGDEATNTAAMAYVDHTGTGMKLVTAEERSAAAKTLVYNNKQYDQGNNDGNRYTMTSGDAESYFGVDTEETWLASDVTLIRGGIEPGIQKQAGTYDPVYQKFTVLNQAKPADEITWKITLYNNGTESMSDYTIVDTLPAPYVLTGTVYCDIRDANGNLISHFTILEVLERTSDALDVKCWLTGQTKTIKINGEATTFGAYPVNGWINVSVSTDGKSNEVVTLGAEKFFKEDDFVGRSNYRFNVPEGGSVEFYLSAVNPTTSYKNSVFTNQAVVVPTQEYTLTSEGTEITLSDGCKGIRATAPVTVSSGFVTSALNGVKFGEDEGSSDPTRKMYVVLDGPGSEFEYTLTVNNDTNQAMSKLVLIDNLPDAENDHTPFDTNAPRDSEFTVHLAKTPGFVVTVVPKEGAPYTPANHTIQYSKSTDFGGPQSSQWMGEESSQWTNDPTDARAIRVIISETIPADAKVTVTFKVKADKDAKPGQTAWNNFGYHYSLEGNSNELEAMPVAVGAKIPSVPKLMKKLVDNTGKALNAARDTEFTFSVSGSNGASKEYTVTVPAGSSDSGWVELTGEGWTWEKGTTYTVTETNIPKPYSFGKFLDGKGDSFSFTYDPAVNQRIICQNVMEQWSIRLTKVDGRDADTVLEGAKFKLYGLETNTAETKEYEGQTWYLCRTGTTDENGVLEWKELDQNKYLLVETKAPDGYQLAANRQWILSRSDAEEGVYKLEVMNYAGYELPETGGMGTALCYIVGGMLSTTAVCTLGKKKRSQTEQE